MYIVYTDNNVSFIYGEYDLKLAKFLPDTRANNGTKIVLCINY